MPERLKYLSDKCFFIYFTIIISAILLQTGCASAQNKTEANVEKSNNINNSINPAKNAELKQEDLTNISKLIARRQLATEKDAKTYQSVFYEAQRYFRAERFTLSGEGFMESVSIYPSVEGLFYTAESVSRIDVKEHPQKERLKYKTAQFEKALIFYQTALEFADKSSQQEELRKFPEIHERIDCLKAYLFNKKVSPCEFVQKILTTNRLL